MTVPTFWTRIFLLWCLASVATAQVNVLIVTEEEHSPAMKQGLTSALSYLEQELQLADFKQNIISLRNETPVSMNAVQTVCGELDSMISAGSPPDLVLDFTLIGEASEVMKKISLNLGLPTVTTALGEEAELWSWAELSPEQQGYLVQVRSPADIFPNVLYDLAKISEINTAVVLYDDTFNLKKHFKNLFSNIPVRHKFIHIEDNADNITDTLDDLIKVDKMMNFFILAEPSTALNIMGAVDRMMRYGSRLAWFVGSLSTVNAAGFGDMRLFQYHPKASAFQSIIDKFQLTEEPLIESAFYADLTLRSILAVDQMKKDGSWPTMEYVGCSEYNGQTIIRDLNIKPALTSDHLTLATNGLSRFQFDVEVARQEPGEDLTAVATWSARALRPEDHPSLEFVAGQEDSLVIKSKREVLQVVTGLHHPFMYYNDTEGEGDLSGYYGFAFDMLNMLSEELGFDYELNIASDNGTYGRRPDAGHNWEGVMGDLINDKADIGLGAIHVTAERAIDVDFTVPFYEYQGWTVMMKREPAHRNPFYFFWIVQWPIWKMLAYAYLLALFVLYFSINISQYSYRNNMEQYVNDPEIRFFGIRELNFFGFFCFTGQGGGMYPKGPTNKFFAVAWWTFAFVTVSTYAANTGANLTINRMITRRETYDLIVNQRMFDFGMMNDSEPWHYYRMMADVEATLYKEYKKISILDFDRTEKEKSMFAVWNFPVDNFHTKFYEKLQEGRYILADDYADAVFKMVNGTRKERNYYAFFSDITDARNLENTWCTVERIGVDHFAAKPYALAVQKGRPKLLAALNAGIMKLQNMKHIESLKEKWWRYNPHKPYCEYWEMRGAYDIWKIGGVFLLMPIGVCISVFYLYLEYVYFKFREWYARSEVRARWKHSWFRSKMPYIFTGQTNLTKENATPEQLEIMARTEEEWRKLKYE